MRFKIVSVQVLYVWCLFPYYKHKMGMNGRDYRLAARVLKTFATSGFADFPPMSPCLMDQAQSGHTDRYKMKG